MPRENRIVIPHLPHHVTQRGNRRQRTFFEESDRELYLSLLTEKCLRYEVSLIAYCLMDNHVHHVVVPNEENSLHLLFKSIHSTYSRMINQRLGWRGHLWQSRFYSNPLDLSHFYSAVRYVELNPVRAGICEIAEDYKWSSAKAHTSGAKDFSISSEDVWHRKLPSREKWRSFLMESQKPMHEAKLIRGAQARNAPVGSKEFVSRIEKRYGVCFSPKRVGRPRKV